MNRRSLLRLIGLAPVAAPMAVAAAHAQARGIGGIGGYASLARFEPGSTMLTPFLDVTEGGISELVELRGRCFVSEGAFARAATDRVREAIASRDFSALTFRDLHPAASPQPEPSYLDLYPDELQPGGAA